MILFFSADKQGMIRRCLGCILLRRFWLHAPKAEEWRWEPGTPLFLGKQYRFSSSLLHGSTSKAGSSRAKERRWHQTPRFTLNCKVGPLNLAQMQFWSFQQE